MSATLFIVARDADGLFLLPDGRRVDTADTPPGAMWRCDCNKELGWLIRLPGKWNLWCTLQDAPQGRWTVTGEAPRLTVSPSLNAGDWHGWIKDGVITP